MKNKISTMLFFILFPYALWSQYCLVYSCNNTIRYSIQRYSNKTINRLNDYRRTIIGSAKSEDVYIQVLQEQNRELAKLLGRVQIENITIKAILLKTERTKSLK